MSKRVHEIAKERGIAPKEALERLRAAGITVKTVSSSVEEAVAARVLDDGGSAQAATKPASAPAKAPTRSEDGGAPAQAAQPAPRPAPAQQPHKRPTRDSLQGERAPGAAGGRRRVVIDSQASRRAPGGGPGQTNQPPRRQRRGRRRRGVYDEEAESRPSTPQTALVDPAIRVNSGP